MARILFSYTDQPWLNPFLWKGEYRFPFVLNGIVYHWEIGADGAALILRSHDIQDSAIVTGNIFPGIDGITLFLENAKTKAQSHVFISFSQLGKGLWSFEQIDDLEIVNLDGFTLGEIEIQASTWAEIRTSFCDILSRTAIKLKNAGFELDSDVEIPIGRTVFLGTLREALGLVGISSIHDADLYELDELNIGDIDNMLSTFRMLGNVPATIVKGIYIHQYMNAHLCVMETIEKLVRCEEKTSMQINTHIDNITISP